MESGLTKKIALFVGILVVVFAGYYFFIRGDDAPEGTLSEETPASTEGLGRELLGKLAQLQSIKLDETFFAEKAYRSLEDYTVKIEDQPVGRPNPFLSVAATALGTSTSSVKLPIVNSSAPKTPAKGGLSL